jgi:hypothetical protein
LKNTEYCSSVEIENSVRLEDFFSTIYNLVSEYSSIRVSKYAGFELLVHANSKSYKNISLEFHTSYRAVQLHNGTGFLSVKCVPQCGAYFSLRLIWLQGVEGEGVIEGNNERDNQNDALIYILILIHLHFHNFTHGLICIRLILNVQLTCSVGHHELEEQLSQKCVIKHLSLA